MRRWPWIALVVVGVVGACHPPTGAYLEVTGEEGDASVSDAAASDASPDAGPPLPQLALEGFKHEAIEIDVNDLDLPIAPGDYIWSVETTPLDATAVLTNRLSPIAHLTGDRAGAYLLSLRGLDGTIIAWIDVAIVNRLPVLELSGTTTVEAGLDASFEVVVTDPDGDPVEWFWQLDHAPAGARAAIATGSQSSLLFRPDNPGQYVVGVTARDSDGAESHASSELDATGDTRFVYLPAYYDGFFDLDASQNFVITAQSTQRDAALIDMATGDVHVFKDLLHPGGTKFVAIGPAAETAVVVEDTTMHVIDTASASITAQWPIGVEVSAVQFVDDARVLLSRNGSAIVMAVSTGATQQILTGMSGAAFSASTGYFYGGNPVYQGMGGLARWLWNGASASYVDTNALETPQYGWQQLHLLQDDTYLLEENGNVYRTDDRSRIGTLAMPSFTSIRGLASRQVGDAWVSVAALSNGLATVSVDALTTTPLSVEIPYAGLRHASYPRGIAESATPGRFLVMGRSDIPCESPCLALTDLELPP